MKKTAYAVFVFSLLVGCATFVVEDKNRPPQFSPIEDQRSFPASELTVPFVVSDEQIEDLKITAESSDQTLVKTKNLKVIGTGNKRKLQIKTESNTGKMSITLRAKDNKELISNLSFNINISAKLDFTSQWTDIHSIALKDNYMIVGLRRSVFILEYKNNNWNVISELKPDKPDQFSSGRNSVAISNNYAVIGVPKGSSMGVYVFKREEDQWIQQTKLKRDTTFGQSLAISNNSILVGYPKLGRVLVFELHKDKWIHSQSLSPKKSTGHNQFGQSISISNQYAVVGMPAISGRVYVFKRNKKTGSWVQKANLLSNDPQNNDYFGQSVAIFNNLIIVGAPGKDDAGADFGAAYIFKRNNKTDTWTQAVKLTGINSGISDHFGNNVAISKRFALVSAPNARLAYTFRHNSDNWEPFMMIPNTRREKRHYNLMPVSISKNFFIVGISFQYKNPSFSGIYTFPTPISKEN